MPNGWIIALKKWNTGKQTWCLPKKGTDAYNEVMALMPGKKLKESAEPEKAAPPMKIPMEKQRKPMSDKDAPKIKFVEPAKKEERFGDEKDDHWITDDLLYAIKHSINWDEAGELKVVSKLKDAIARFQRGYDKNIKTDRHQRITKKLNDVLNRMIKEHGRKKKVSGEVIQTYLQPLFTYNLMIADSAAKKKEPKEKKPKKPSLASLLKEYKGPYQSYDDSEGNEVMYPTRVIKELITLAYNGASLNEIAAAIGYDKDEVKIMLYDNYESRM